MQYNTIQYTGRNGNGNGNGNGKINNNGKINSNDKIKWQHQMATSMAMAMTASNNGKQYCMHCMYVLHVPTAAIMASMYSTDRSNNDKQAMQQ